MRNIRGELAAVSLGKYPIGDIKGKQCKSDRALSGIDPAYVQAVFSSVSAEGKLRMSGFRREVNRAFDIASPLNLDEVASDA